MNHFIGSIYVWYSQNRRDLPWRKTSDPYIIWVSEIILQQTRILQGLPYFNRIISKYPNVKSLAEASQDELLKLWEGLGYYSRARNMQYAAQTILRDHNGIFPDSYENIRNLKGIGDYTAAAIVSIAYGQPRAVVDGNVNRLISRYFGIKEPIDTATGKQIILQIANEYLSHNDPGMHNQAVMEYGAMVCTFKNPDCLNCRLNDTCFAYNYNIVQQLPAKSKTMVRKARYFYFLLMEDTHNLLIEKRTGNDIWKNLYQLPLLETLTPLSEEEILSHPFFMNYTSGTGELINVSIIFNHALTHQQIKARFIHFRTKKLTEMEEFTMVVGKKDISKYAFPVLVKKYLTKLEIV